MSILHSHFYYTFTTFIRWPIAQPKIAVMIIFVVYESTDQSEGGGGGPASLVPNFVHVHVYTPFRVQALTY